MPAATYRHVLTLLACLIALLWPANRAAANAQDGEATLALGDITTGRLLIPDGAARYLPVPLLRTEVHMRVAGASAGVSVVQRFRNPGSEWVEGVYVFPLPENAAVHRLRMHVGERVIEGQVKERAEAKKTYAKARAEGRKTSLVEQERPNIFTTSVANIGPGEEVVVELAYVEALRFVDGRFRLRFPLVTGPRYIPGEPVHESAQASGSGWAFDTELVPDASRITPPVLHPDAGPVNPVALSVEISAGFPLARVASSFHAMHFETAADGAVRGELEGTNHADRDFELAWAPELGHAPRAAAFAEARDGAHYLQLMVMPPAPGAEGLRTQARELILVIDTSGSMEGQSIQQALAAAGYALEQLAPGDAFNIIQFNSTSEALFAQPRDAGPQALAAARAFLVRLRAQGGTNMAPALASALAGHPNGGRVRQVVFLTDGSVGNEEQLFELIRARLAQARLFTVGIGSAPNSYFMSRAAEFGRGSYTYVGKLEEVHTRMAELFARIRHPVLTDVAFDWAPAQAVEAWPARVPDLYHGEPLVVFARTPAAAQAVTIHGRLGGQPWQFRMPLQQAGAGEAVSTLWARAGIRALMDRQLGGRASDETRRAIIDLGTRFNLVTRYTSLVAVDVTPARPAGAPVHATAVPANLPRGWSYPHVFGGLPGTAAGVAWHLGLGSILLLLAALLWWRVRCTAVCVLPRR